MAETIVSIRPAEMADALQLQQFSIITFTDTYAAYNTPENMRLYIENYFNYSQVLSELNDTAMQYFLAFADDELAGYIKIRTVDNPAELAGIKHIEIERIYVLPKYKGMQIGTKLINHAGEMAKQQGFKIIWLGVWAENKNALAFYTKMGFSIFGEHNFVLGTEPQRDWLMKKELP